MGQTRGGPTGNGRHNLVNGVLIAADVVAICKYTDSAHYPTWTGLVHHPPTPLSDGNALQSRSQAEYWFQQGKSEVCGVGG